MNSDQLDLTGAHGAIRRRHITCLQTDLCDYTELTEQTEYHNVRALTDIYRAAADEIARKYAGKIVRQQGDGVLIVFGHTNPQENDILRAADAALALHEAVRSIQLDPALYPHWFKPQLHSGIHAGVVEVGEGSRTEGILDLIGGSINLATKLQRMAGNDQVYVSKTAFGEVLPFFETEDLGDLVLTKHGMRLGTFRILGKSDVARRFEGRKQRGLTQFIGRQQEIQRLRDSLTSDVKRNGRLKVVTIVGDRGIGKTRIAEEFWSETKNSGIGMHRGYCENFRSATPESSPTAAPLQPFLQMLTHIFKIDHTTSPARSASNIGNQLEKLAPGLVNQQQEIERMLSLTPFSGGKADFESEQLAVRVITQLFSELASVEPQLLFIDDWQWADNASRKVLANLTREAADKPIMILTTSRDLHPSDPAMVQAEILTIEPFSGAETEQAVSKLLFGWLGPGFVENVQMQSGGNPLYIEEICRAPYMQVEMAVSEKDEDFNAIPVWLRGLIEGRVQMLPPEQAEIVRIAAVAGYVVPMWLLQELCGEHLDEDVIQELTNKDLLHVGEARGTVRFTHGITRDVIYNLVGKERQALHQRIADALEKSGGPGGREELFEPLAYHYAGALDYEQAAYYAEYAGDKAMVRSSMDRAQQQYGAALNALEKMPQTKSAKRRWLRIVRSWALPSVYNPDASLLEILSKSLDIARELESDDDHAHLLYWLGYMNYALGNLDDAASYCRQAIDLATDISNKRLAAQAMAVLGQIHAAACEYPSALKNLDKAIESKRRKLSKNSPPVGSAYASACKAFVLADIGEFDEAHACIEEALLSIQGRTHEIESSIQNIRCAIHLWRGQWEKVLEISKISQAIAERVSLQYDFAMSRAVEAYAKCMLSGADTAVGDLLTTIKYLDQRRIRLFISLPNGWLTDVLVSSGDYELAREYGKITRDLAQKKDRLGEAMACRALARAAAKDPDNADESPDYYFDLSLASARARGSRHEEAVTQLQQSQYLLSEQRAGEAAPLLKRATDAFAAMKMLWHHDKASELLNQC